MQYLVGESIVQWLWGGYAVDDPIMIYVLHWLLAFVILGIVILHVIALHIVGSNQRAVLSPKTQETQ